MAKGHRQPATMPSVRGISDRKTNAIPEAVFKRT
jgi:hypothetical protein